MSKAKKSTVKGRPGKATEKQVKATWDLLLAFDALDTGCIQRVQDALWMRSRHDALMQCLRVASGVLAVSPTAWKLHDRDAEAGFQWGTASRILVRMTPREKAALDQIVDATGGRSMAESFRLAVRVAAKSILKTTAKSKVFAG